jgi:NhaC family Na+:H+ antiporter
MTTPDEEPKSLTWIEAIVPVAALILLIGLSYHLFGDAGADGPIQVALVAATMIAVFIAWRRGHTLEDLREGAIASVSSGMSAIFILFGVGALIGTWAMSGTLLAMIYYGLQLLSPNFFYMTTALICAVVSASIGTSWTVVGTIGVGLMGISQNMEMNPAITAAAIISGAYFGDTTSPVSGSPSLAAAAAGAELYDNVRETLVISSAALVISLVVFGLLGRPGDFDASAKIAAIEGTFHMSPVLFLPLVVVAGLALLKTPPFTAIFVGALAGGVLAVLVAPERVIAFAGAPDGTPRWLAQLKGVWLALAGGYVSKTGQPMVDQLVTRGGMASMLQTIWLIIAALAFGGVVEKAGVLERLIAPVIAAAKSAGALVASLVGSVLATNIATADQYIAIVLPGRMFKTAFAQRGLAPVVLSRTISASATPTSALVPWNSCGAFMAATLGVSSFSYLPYAVFNIASPLIAVAMVFAGWRTWRAKANPLSSTASDP